MLRWWFELETSYFEKHTGVHWAKLMFAIIFFTIFENVLFYISNNYFSINRNRWLKIVYHLLYIFKLMFVSTTNKSYKHNILIIDENEDVSMHQHYISVTIIERRVHSTYTCFKLSIYFTLKFSWTSHKII